MQPWSRDCRGSRRDRGAHVRPDRPKFSRAALAKMLIYPGKMEPAMGLDPRPADYQPSASRHGGRRGRRQTAILSAISGAVPPPCAPSCVRRHCVGSPGFSVKPTGTKESRPPKQKKELRAPPERTERHVCRIALRSPPLSSQCLWMSQKTTDAELRIKAQQVLDGLVLPGSLPEAVSELLDAIVNDMRHAAAEAAADARELVAAEGRLAKIESQVRVLTATVITIAHSVANIEQRLLLIDGEAPETAPDG